MEEIRYICADNSIDILMIVCIIVFRIVIELLIDLVVNDSIAYRAYCIHIL